GVAVLVVDLFEMVQIDHGQTEGPALPPSLPVHLAVHQLQHVAPVEQPGECIDLAQALNLVQRPSELSLLAVQLAPQALDATSDQGQHAHRARDQGELQGQQIQGGGLWVLRSEEHTSELQSRENLVCRLLL